MHRLAFAILIYCFALASSSTTLAANKSPEPPGRLVQQAVYDTLVDGLRVSRQKRNSYALLKKHIWPIFDLDAIGERLLGNEWSSASESDQAKFIAAYTNALTSRLDTAALQFDSPGYRSKWYLSAPLVYQIQGYDLVTVSFVLEQQFKDDISSIEDDVRPDKKTFRSMQHYGSSIKVPITLLLERGANRWQIFDGSIGEYKLIESFRREYLKRVQNKDIREIAESIRPFPCSLTNKTKSTVQLKILVEPRGTVGQTKVIESSDNQRIDRVAENIVKEWRFIPAIWDGRYVEGYALKTFNFICPR